MSRVEKTIDVHVPVRDAYDQWTQFEEFPRFMEGVEGVRQLDDRTLEWRATVGGSTKQWTAEITDQTPDTRVAWKSVDGARNAGAVRFEPLGLDDTRIWLTIDADPDGPLEQAGDALGFLDRRVSGDLDRFKAFVEERETPTGAWRGEIHGDAVIEPAGAVGRAASSNRDSSPR